VVRPAQSEALAAAGRPYRDSVDQVVWAEQRGFRSAWLSERARLPGEPLESGSERIQYPADKVIPAVTEKLSRQDEAAGVPW
jgi:hypothetical protein